MIADRISLLLMRLGWWIIKRGVACSAWTHQWQMRDVDLMMDTLLSAQRSCINYKKGGIADEIETDG